MPETICPSCSTKLAVPEAAVGRKVKCPKCNTVFVVPSASSQPVPAQAPKPPSESNPEHSDPFDFDAPEPEKDDRPAKRPRSRDEDGDSEDRPTKRRRSERDRDEDDDRRKKRDRDNADDDEDDRPGRRRRWDEFDDDDDRRRPKQNAPILIWLGRAALGYYLLIGFVVLRGLFVCFQSQGQALVEIVVFGAIAITIYLPTAIVLGSEAKVTTRKLSNGTAIFGLIVSIVTVLFGLFGLLRAGMILYEVTIGGAGIANAQLMILLGFVSGIAYTTVGAIGAYAGTRVLTAPSTE